MNGYLLFLLLYTVVGVLGYQLGCWREERRRRGVDGMRQWWARRQEREGRVRL